MYATSQTFKKQCSRNELTYFYTLENMISDDSHDLFRFLFWNWFLMSCGIDVASIWAPRWDHIPCFSQSLFLFFGWYFKLFRKLRWRYSLFHHYFDHVPQVVFLNIPWLTLASLLFLLIEFWLFWVFVLIHFEFLGHKTLQCGHFPKTPAE